MDCKVLKTIQADFDALWGCKAKGNTVVITTPFSHALSSLVNVYLTERDKQFVVSDGGDLYRLVASQEINWNRNPLQKAIGQFVQQFEIKITTNQGKESVPMYYMKVADMKEISSAIFNLAHFIVAVADFAVSLMAPTEEEVEEKQSRDVFENETDHFLKTTYEPTGHTLDFHGKISKFTPSVIIDGQHSIQYISGERPRTFGGDAGRASLIYQGVEDLHLIKTFVAFVDDYARGFQDEQNQKFVEMLKMDKVFRSQKESILDLIPA